MADTAPLTLADVDLMVEHARKGLGALLAPPMSESDISRAEGMARTLESLLRSREMLAPRLLAVPPSTSTRPGLKQETLSGTPAPGSNEMVANATRERLHHEVQRLVTGGTDLERSKADILRLVDGLHTLAVSGAPGPRSGIREQVAQRLTELAEHMTEAAGSPRRLLLNLANEVRGMEPADYRATATEAMRAACVRLAESHLATLHGHERVARDSGHEDEARHWAAEAETVHNLVEAMRALPTETSPEGRDRWHTSRMTRLEAVATAARDMHLGAHGAQQRLEDALCALDGVR